VLLDLFFFDLRVSTNAIRAIKARPKTPPTTPPTIGPVLEPPLEPEELAGSAVDVSSERVPEVAVPVAKVELAVAGGEDSGPVCEKL
jgi:hypothetical protein